MNNVYKMKRLKFYLNMWQDGETVKGLRTPPLHVINELYDIYAGIQKTTICFDVFYILKVCGIKVKKSGIGWEIL